MISNDKYEFVKKAIKVHSGLKDRTYLILYKASAGQMAKTMETSILEENFWHLVGCKIDDAKHLTPEMKKQIYQECVEGKDISDSLICTRQEQDISKKSNIVINMFDFVANAKLLKLCHTEGTPETAMFRVGAGTANGVIGYCDSNYGMVPKTAQEKSIYNIKSNANDKIFMIISKPYGNAKYDRLDYAISPKIFPAIIDELPTETLFDKRIFLI